MINSRKSVTAITILLLISSVIGGCFGNENEEVYSGPIDIVLILSANSGTLEISKGNGNETIDQQTNSVEIEFENCLIVLLTVFILGSIVSVMATAGIKKKAYLYLS